MRYNILHLISRLSVYLWVTRTPLLAPHPPILSLHYFAIGYNLAVDSLLDASYNLCIARGDL
jgi:hypothetical protein